MELSRVGRRSPGWSLAAAGAAAVALTWLRNSSLSGPPPPALAVMFLLLAAPLFALDASVRAVGREHSGGRLRWYLLAGAALMWSAAFSIRSIFPLMSESALSSAPSVALELTALSLVMTSMLLLALRALKGPDWVGMILDVGIVAASLIFLGGAAVLAQRLAVGDSGVEQTLALAFPIGNILACSLVLLVLSRAPRAGRTWLAFMACGLLGLALADTGFAPARFGGEAAGVLLTGWPLGWLMLGAAAHWSVPGTDRAARPRQATRTSVLVTVVPLTIAVVSAVPFISGGDYGPVLGFIGVAAVVLVLGRQVVTILDGASVARRLEAEVESRTAELRKSEVRFRSLLQGSSDVITLVDSEGMILYQTPSVERVFGFVPADYAGRALTELLHPDDVTRARATLAEAAAQPDATTAIEWRMRRSGGGYAECETLVRSLLHDPQVEGIVLNTRDVTERKALEEQLIREALHDPLTQLANRALLRDRINQALARVRRGGRSVALLLVDLDDFKAVNDGLGHAAGDTVLQLLARRLQQCVRPGDTVARLGGDEFAILVEEDEVEGHVANLIAERMHEALRSPLLVDGHEVFAPASIGVAPGEGCGDADEMVRNADVALYVAKGRGKNQHAVFEPAMHEAMRDRLTLATELRRAVSEGQFALRYQPVVDLATGSVVSTEALVRWHHPTRGMVSPAEFIRVAESTGVIVPLGRWILTEACEAAARMHARQPAGAKRFSVAVNLSARQFQDDSLIDDIAAVLKKTGVDPWSIVFELTETMLMDDIEGAIDRLYALKRLGVRLALDDFGTGYSSLSYLSRFPIDILKIDQSFIAALATEEGPGLVRSIVRIGDTFKLATLAEGIEHPDHLAVLRGLGCTYGQGYLFSRPLREQELMDRLEQQWRGDPPAPGVVDTTSVAAVLGALGASFCHVGPSGADLERCQLELRRPKT